MSIFLLSLFGFLKAHWKIIGIVCGITAIVYFVYDTGRRDCERRIESITQKEVQRRFEADQKEQDRLVKIRRRINRERSIQPINDKRDSCILSNDPYTKRCIP